MIAAPETKHAIARPAVFNNLFTVLSPFAPVPKMPVPGTDFAHFTADFR